MSVPCVGGPCFGPGVGTAPGPGWLPIALGGALSRNAGTESADGRRTGTIASTTPTSIPAPSDRLTSQVSARLGTGDRSLPRMIAHTAIKREILYAIRGYQRTGASSTRALALRPSRAALC